MNRAVWIKAGVAALILAWIAAAGARGGAHGAQKSKEKNSEPASLLAPDQGTFAILVDGQAAGTEEFEIRPSGGGEWTARGSAEVAGEGGVKSKVTGKLQLSSDGAPRRYEWTTSSPRKAAATIMFEAGVAHAQLRIEGASPYSQDFDFKTPAVVILDNNMYHQYAILAQIYDWEHKEAKSYPVLIPQDMTPGSISVEYGGEQVLDGQKVELMRVHTQDLEVDLYCDSSPQHRLLKLDVPAAKAQVVRQAAKK